ncbi:MAG: hypothetical protein ACM3OO_06710 [Planctomycetaceae bacterium]
MRFGRYVFGSIEIDGQTYDHDVVIEDGRIRKRKKGPSKQLRSRYGHTPLTAAEDIPWGCRRLVVGSGYDGALPVQDDLAEEARARGVDLVVTPTEEAIELLGRDMRDTNAILHVTC